MNKKIVSLILLIGLLLFVVVTFLMRQLSGLQLSQSIQAPTSQKQSSLIPGWDLYTDTIHFFTIQHPTSSPVTPSTFTTQPDATAPTLHLSTAADLIISGLTVARSNDTIIGVSLYTSPDIAHCFDFQIASSTAVIINAVPFKTAAWSDAAMGGERGVIRQYRTVHNNTCYILESIVHYRDVAFLAGVTGNAPHTASPSDIKQQADWIAQQQKLQSQIIGTFMFSR